MNSLPQPSPKASPSLSGNGNQSGSVRQSPGLRKVLKRLDALSEREASERYLPNIKVVRTSPHGIIQAVEEAYNLRPGELKRHSSEHRIVRPRQVAWFLTRRLTGYSFPQIGKYFGGFHHSTVLHGIAQVEAACRTSTEVQAFVDELERKLREERTR